MERIVESFCLLAMILTDIPKGSFQFLFLRKLLHPESSQKAASTLSALKKIGMRLPNLSHKLAESSASSIDRATGIAVPEP